MSESFATQDAVDLRSWLEEHTLPERAVIARLWQLPPSQAESPPELAGAMLDQEVVRRVLATLGARDLAALALVQSYGGRLAAPVLEREFGSIRDATRFPNPRAYLLALDTPPSPTERLFLLGLLQPLQNGAHGSYVITPDVLPLLPSVAPAPAGIVVQPVAPPESPVLGSTREFERCLLSLLTLAQEGALDVTPGGGLNKASLVRLVREWQPAAKLQGATREEHLPFVHFLRIVAQSADLVRVGADAKLRPTRVALDWMRMPMLDRARVLLDGWVAAPYDELVRLAGMSFGRAYGRDLTRAKRALLRMLAPLPPNEWIAFDDFRAAVKASEPDYGRPRGQYDTWGVQNYARLSLDGFGHWDAVEGEQIRRVIGFSLYWLGLADYAVRDSEFDCFRVNTVGVALLHKEATLAEPPVELLVVQPNFEVLVPPYARLYDRFQIGRVAERMASNEVTSYRLTKRAIQVALAPGTSYEDIERFLVEAAGRPLPQNVAATLRDWAGQHDQVSFRRVVLLETQDAALMQQVRHDKRLHFPPAEQISATIAIVGEGDAVVLAERIRKAGYGLAGEGISASAPLNERDMTVVMAALEFYAGASARLGVESDVSQALLRRVARLLSETQLNRAYQSSGALLRRLDPAG